MTDGVRVRLERIFGSSKKAVVVACDHGMFDGPHEGMEDVPGMLHRLGDGPDAILLAPGMLPKCHEYFGRRGAPAAVVRLNFNSVFCFRWKYSEAVIAHLWKPIEAAAAGADAVLVCLTLRTGSERIDARNAEIFSELCLESHRLGLPVCGEYFPSGHLAKGPAAFHEEVLVGCRMLFELGADFIKTFHTCRFREITSACQIPVLGLGAEKKPTDFDALALAERLVADGASGVVFGRNVVQSSNPRAFVSALHEIVKNGRTASYVVKKHHLTGRPCR